MEHPRASPVALNSIVHHLPATASQTIDSSEPQLILIFAWMDAKFLHIMKYSSKYSALFPSAAQILIQSDMAASCSGTSAMNLRRMQPLVKLMSEYGVFSENPPRMLFHAFSAGGTAQLLWLARALRDATKTNFPRLKPRTGIIFDSTPALFDYPALIRLSMPSYSSMMAYQKLFGLVGVTALWIVDNANGLLRIRPGSMQQFIHGGMNNPRILEWTDSDTPRLYLYSDADYLMQVAPVRAHIAGVRKAGMMNVSAEEFRGSGHVQHASKDPERYWVAVRQLWVDVVRPKAKL
ncbi:hypothetical protein FB45DRAFT_926253 [Roridomyces roridus]|uniref:Uncharacterized protein n=1 Tax=Roridomyces roridus TaxID=1738132 RepID=A0AAD7BK97_9AGAR|nr:hypothetical protein FB45DRAFT_926253 [Roridomyces roridus]